MSLLRIESFVAGLRARSQFPLERFVQNRRKQRVEFGGSLGLKLFQRVYPHLHGIEFSYYAVLIPNRWDRNLEDLSVTAAYTNVSRCCFAKLLDLLSDAS